MFLIKCRKGRQKEMCIYRAIHELFPPLSEGIPDVIWNKKCEYTNGMQPIIKEIQ
jgi:hypothetical protein